MWRFLKVFEFCHVQITSQLPGSNRVLEKFHASSLPHELEVTSVFVPKIVVHTFMNLKNEIDLLCANEAFAYKAKSPVKSTGRQLLIAGAHQLHFQNAELARI